jgi:hypothetical protein
MKIFATIQCDHYECAAEARARINVGYTSDHRVTLDADVPSGWTYVAAYVAYGDSYDAECFCPEHKPRRS